MRPRVTVGNLVYSKNIVLGQTYYQVKLNVRVQYIYSIFYNDRIVHEHSDQLRAQTCTTKSRDDSVVSGD